MASSRERQLSGSYFCQRVREREREGITNKDANHNSDAPFSKCKACVPADPKFKFSQQMKIQSITSTKKKDHWKNLNLKKISQFLHNHQL